MTDKLKHRCSKCHYKGWAYEFVPVYLAKGKHPPMWYFSCPWCGNVDVLTELRKVKVEVEE